MRGVDDAHSTSTSSAAVVFLWEEGGERERGVAMETRCVGKDATGKTAAFLAQHQAVWVF